MCYCVAGKPNRANARRPYKLVYPSGIHEMKNKRKAPTISLILDQPDQKYMYQVDILAVPVNTTNAHGPCQV